MSLRRRLRPTALLALTAALVIAGCGSSDDGATDDGPDGGGASQEAPEGHYPVTFEHAHGSTTIESQPERVVTIGWITHDIVAELGVVPVAVPETWGGDDEGFSPWFRDQITELGGEMPDILNQPDGEPDFEQILALAPDVILAPHSGVTEVQYERLSEIAPTIAYEETPWLSNTWPELTTLVGDALGVPEVAEEKIAQTQELIETSTAEYPNLEGASFLYGLGLTSGEESVGIYVASDPRVVFLRELGLVDSPSLAEISQGFEDGSFVGGVSLEELDTLDTDLFVGWSNDADTTAYTLAHPTFTRWAPIAEGRYYLLEDNTLAMATNGPSGLSIAWSFEDGFLEELSSAIDGGGVVRPASN